MRCTGILAFLIAAAVSITACTSSEGASHITGPTYYWGKLAVDVNVNGDPKASSRAFVLHVNSEYQPVKLAGRTTMTLQQGDYGVSLQPASNWWLDDGMPSWCFVPQDNVIVVHIGKDSTTTISLEIECPPVAGNARIRIHGVATGPNAPSEVTYWVQRIHPTNTDPSTSVRISLGGIQDLSGEPGIYLIVPTDEPEKCDSWWGDFFGIGAILSNSAGYVLVRDGQVVDVSNALNCP